jgi:hypothetical protein
MDQRITAGTSGFFRTHKSCHLPAEMVGASRSIWTGFFLAEKRLTLFCERSLHEFCSPSPFLEITHRLGSRDQSPEQLHTESDDVRGSGCWALDCIECTSGCLDLLLIRCGSVGEGPSEP